MKISPQSILFVGGLSLWMAGSLQCHRQAVRPDEMSADRHREEAQRVEQAAEEHERKYNKAARHNMPPPPPPGGDVDYDFLDPTYNPTEWHVAKAGHLRDHANEHLRAAKNLEQFEQGECKYFPAATRAACPLLGPVTTIEDIPQGVRVTLSQGTRNGVVLAHMRCHYAYAQAQGFKDDSTCALYVKGIDIRPSADQTSIEIVSKDQATIKTIRARTREEAVILHGRSP